MHKSSHPGGDGSYDLFGFCVYLVPPQQRAWDVVEVGRELGGDWEGPLFGTRPLA